MTLAIPQMAGDSRPPTAPDARLMAVLEQRLLAVAADYDGVLGQALRHHLQSGGSRVRPRLVISAGIRLGLDEDVLVRCALACELVHNASLIHDDLQDRDRTRRDREAVWSKFGDNIAVCAGDLLLSAAYAALPQYVPSGPDLTAAFHRNIAQLIAGQCEDLSRDQAVDFQAYRRIVERKSGSLFALPLQLVLLLAGRGGAVAQANEVAHHFALGYQIYDDLCDVDKDAQRGSLNAVAVLAANHNDPQRQALQLASQHLSRAVELSAALPEDCGYLLRTQARSLMQVLNTLPLRSQP